MTTPTPQPFTGPVGVGFIGAGVISDQYLTNLTAFPDVKVLILGDLDTERAASQAQKYGVPASGIKITMLTCYDYPTAVLQEEAGFDVIFVGDSVGTNVLGYDNETLVTFDEMVHLWMKSK